MRPTPRSMRPKRLDFVSYSFDLLRCDCSPRSESRGQRGRRSPPDGGRPDQPPPAPGCPALWPKGSVLRLGRTSYGDGDPPHSPLKVYFIATLRIFRRLGPISLPSWIANALPGADGLVRKAAQIGRTAPSASSVRPARAARSTPPRRERTPTPQYFREIGRFVHGNS